MKMTRAEKRRRKIAKLVEMKLDGIDMPDWGRPMSYHDLCRFHRFELANKNKPQMDYYGASVTAQVMNQKAIEMQRSIDRAILEELNGKTSK